jgi:hypothetical protein
MKSFRAWSAKLGLLAASLAVAALLAEGAQRLAGAGPTQWYEPDPVLGWRLIPNIEGSWRREGNTHPRINSAGWRDHEHSLAKPPRTFRIAVLGDSYTEAMQVPLEQAFFSVAQRRLAKCGGHQDRRVEVLAFGVSGWSTAQERLALDQCVLPYSPDLVVLAVCTSNDIRDEVRSLALEKRRPFYHLVDGRLVVDFGFRKALSYRIRRTAVVGWAMRHSRLAREAASMAIWARTQVALLRQRGIVRDPAAHPDLALYRPPREKAWADAWQVTEALVADINRDVSARGVRFLVVLIDTSIQVDPGAAARLGVADLFYPVRRFRELGRREGFPVLALAPALAAYVSKHHVFLHGDPATHPGEGHWNVLGSRLAGRLIAQEICAELEGGWAAHPAPGLDSPGRVALDHGGSAGR